MDKIKQNRDLKIKFIIEKIYQDDMSETEFEGLQVKSYKIYLYLLFNKRNFSIKL